MQQRIADHDTYAKIIKRQKLLHASTAILHVGYEPQLSSLYYFSQISSHFKKLVQIIELKMIEGAPKITN